jgi:hypothetical protein
MANFHPQTKTDTDHTNHKTNMHNMVKMSIIHRDKKLTRITQITKQAPTKWSTKTKTKLTMITHWQRSHKSWNKHAQNNENGKNGHHSPKQKTDNDHTNHITSTHKMVNFHPDKKFTMITQKWPSLPWTSDYPVGLGSWYPHSSDYYYYFFF